MRRIWLYALLVAACERPPGREPTPVAAVSDAQEVATPPAEVAPAAPVDASIPDAILIASSDAAVAAAPGQHPGTITFVDVDGSEKVRPASEVPETIAWVRVGGKRVPVVRVVRTGSAQRFEIVSYGVDGAELARTIGHAPPRRP